MEIRLTPIATVKNTRTAPGDDFWGGVISEIELTAEIPAEAFDGIGLFSHLEIIYYFNRTSDTGIVYGRHPRGNPIEHTGRTIRVKYLDAIDGTPVLDIKPVFREFQPKTAVRQPQWVADLTKDYWELNR